jgi:hypothetical protein
MGPQLGCTVDISRPLDDVYRFFVDVEENVPKMDPAIESVVSTTDKPFGIGSEYRMRMIVAGKLRDTKMWVTGLEEKRKIGFAADLGPVAPTFEIAFEPLENGTRVIYSGAPNPVGFFKLFTSRITKQARGIWEMRLQRTKAVLEASPAASS